MVLVGSGLIKIVNRAAPEHKLELWSFEASPYSRVVRSVLSELELPYILHSVAKERWQDMGPAILRLKPGKYEPLKEGKREKLLPVMQGKMQVPYLVDPNTGVKMFESAEIVKYLKTIWQLKYKLEKHARALEIEITQSLLRSDNNKKSYDKT